MAPDDSRPRSPRASGLTPIYEENCCPSPVAPADGCREGGRWSSGGRVDDHRHDRDGYAERDKRVLHRSAAPRGAEPRQRVAAGSAGRPCSQVAVPAPAAPAWSAPPRHQRSIAAMPGASAKPRLAASSTGVIRNPVSSARSAIGSVNQGERTRGGYLRTDIAMEPVVVAHQAARAGVGS